MTNFRLEIFQGKEILQWIDVMAELRIREFREFPYLYVGNIENERKYLEAYANVTDSLFVLAFDGDVVAGISTGVPLGKAQEVLPGGAELLASHGLDVQTFYYYGEIIVAPAYRGRWLASKLFHEQAERVKQLGYSAACGMTVDRGLDHPLRPKDYRDEYLIGKKMGFVSTDIHIELEWPTLAIDGSVENLKHSLSFWMIESL